LIGLGIGAGAGAAIGASGIAFSGRSGTGMKRSEGAAIFMLPLAWQGLHLETSGNQCNDIREPHRKNREAEMMQILQQRAMQETGIGQSSLWPHPGRG